MAATPRRSFSEPRSLATKQNAILHKSHFYAQYGTNSRRDGMVCMRWQRDPVENEACAGLQQRQYDPG